MKLVMLFVMLVVSGAIVTYTMLRAGQFVALKSDGAPVPAITLTPVPTTSPTPTPKSDEPLPAKVELQVPFLAQAPFANWDPVHEETCEEASLLNVMYFLGKPPFESKAKGDEQLLEMVAFEESKGMGVSITLDQLNQVAREKYGMTTGRVETDITINDIKKELADGKPVIVGAAGKILANPFFSNGGPVYHMLVVKGYDDNAPVPGNKCKNVGNSSCNGSGVFITNDVGISQGNSFLYRYDAFYEAIHDWDPSNIHNGQKAYLVFD